MTFAFVVGAVSAAQGSMPATSGVDTTGADLIVTSNTQAGAASDVGVPTDFYGNTYSTILVDSSFDHPLRLSYAHADTNGSALSVGSGHTFTPHGVNGYGTLSVGAYSGSKASGVLDQSISAGNGSNVNSPGSPGSKTPTTASSLAVSTLALHDDATFGSYTESFGFTIRSASSANPSSGHYTGGALADNFPATSAQTPSWGFWFTGAWAAALAIFKPTGGSPPPAASGSTLSMMGCA